jgi:polynucleotide 5'-kinase involved in rRNA processing
MQSKSRGRDNSGSSEDDNVPITLPLLPLEAPDDASDHSPIILPLKSAEAVKAECRRERKRHRQQAARRRIREERERPRDTEEDRMNRALEEEAMEFSYNCFLEMKQYTLHQAAALLHEETARIEEHQEQAMCQERRMQAMVAENIQEFEQQVREHDWAQIIRQ